MALKLNTPKIPESNKPATNAETARFIAGASKKNATSKAKLLNFRLNENFEGILESEAIRTGQSKTTVLKAALAAWDNMDENQRNHWLLESAKIG